MNRVSTQLIGSGIKGLVLGTSEVDVEKTVDEDPRPMLATGNALSRGLIHETMRAVCLECAVGAGLLWDSMRNALRDTTGSTEQIDNVEPLIARMLAHDLKASGKSHGHLDLIKPILEAICGTADKVDDYGLPLFEMLEASGVRFRDHRAVRSVRVGITLRVRQAPEDEAETDPRFNDFLNLLSRNLAPLDPNQRAVLANGNTLLRGLDLFADGLGAVPLDTCLRIAIFLEGKRVSWTETFYLWKRYAPDRSSELLAYVSDPRVTVRDVERALYGV